MNRIDIAFLILSCLPFVMALIFSFAVVPARKKALERSLEPENRPQLNSSPKQQLAEQAIVSGVKRAVKTYDSIASSRLLIPAAILSTLYWLGFSLGISVLLDKQYADFGLIRPFTGFDEKLLSAPCVAALGAYIFNMSMLVRRAFVADFNKNVMWASLNRLIFACGLGIFLELTQNLIPTIDSRKEVLLASFAVAFFPRIFLTYIRKKVTDLFGVSDDTCSELSIQLIQGIDIWKEERLEEEGIEGIQNMATADIFDLIPKLHFPIRTIVDWMDQAIYIQRFATCFQDDKGVPSRLRDLEQKGFRISAISAAAMGEKRATDDPCKEEFVHKDLIAKMAEAINIDSLVLSEVLAQLNQDAMVILLARIWSTGVAEA